MEAKLYSGGGSRLVSQLKCGCKALHGWTISTNKEFDETKTYFQERTRSGIFMEVAVTSPYYSGDLVKNSENDLQTSGLPVTVVDVCGKSYTRTSLLKDSFENSVTGFIMNVDIDMALVFETT